MQPSAAERAIVTRVSTLEGDPGYTPDAHRYRVRFNGVLQPEEGAERRRVIFTADSETGEIVYAWVGLVPGRGRMLETEGDVDSPGGWRIVHRRDTGAVEILRREDVA